LGDEEIQHLDVEDLIDLAAGLLGDPPPIRDLGLLASAAARPPTVVYGREAYPDVWSKAAALLDSLVNNHALVDGNKRLGWLATAVFLEINGVAITKASNQDVYELVMEVVLSNRTIKQIARALRKLSP
jgi:death-on-curing protein